MVGGLKISLYAHFQAELEFYPPPADTTSTYRTLALNLYMYTLNLNLRKRYNFKYTVTTTSIGSHMNCALYSNNSGSSQPEGAFVRKLDVLRRSNYWPASVSCLLIDARRSELLSRIMCLWLIGTYVK